VRTAKALHGPALTPGRMIIHVGDFKPNGGTQQ
jgi:hypothetical protein